MNSRASSILTELNNLSITKNTDGLIETRGMNIIASAINLLELIHKQYDEDIALNLERRLLNAIKSGDAKKFERGMKIVKKRK